MGCYLGRQEPSLLHADSIEGRPKRLASSQSAKGDPWVQTRLGSPCRVPVPRAWSNTRVAGFELARQGDVVLGQQEAFTAIRSAPRPADMRIVIKPEHG
jgi:hypothetical protein